MGELFVFDSQEIFIHFLFVSNFPNRQPLCACLWPIWYNS